MFSLIISIIAIALVAALALASIYYGGDAFQEGTAKAEASTVINQGQQVQAAVTMSEIDENTVTAVSDLIVSDGSKPQYLKEVPSVRGEKWTIVGDNAELTVINAEVCEYIEVAFDGDTSVGVVDTQAFGCYDKTGTPTAYYKL